MPNPHLEEMHNRELSAWVDSGAFDPTWAAEELLRCEDEQREIIRNMQQGSNILHALWPRRLVLRERLEILREAL